MILCNVQYHSAIAGLLLASAVVSTLGQNQPIYTDSLQNGYQSWSWGSTINLANTGSGTVHSGSDSIAVTITSAYGALYLQNPTSFNSSPYTNLTFWINGGTSGGQLLKVQALTNMTALPNSVSVGPLAAATWQQVTIPLSALGVANQRNMGGIWLQDLTGGAQPTFYVDDIVLVTNSSPPPTVTLTSPANGSSYTSPASIPLAANVVSNGQTITKVQFYNGATLLSEDLTPPYTSTWTNVSLGTYSLFARAIYGSGGSVDSAAVSVTVIGNVVASIAVDAQLNRHPISPLIYGVAFASPGELMDGNLPLNRSGGNEETTYNWQANTHGKGADWYFESYPDSSSIPGATADGFVSDSLNGGAQPMITVPIIGWAPKPGPGRSILWSYSVAKYGPQTRTDPYRPDAGNGFSSTNGNAPITWNNPLDANFPTNTAFEQTYVQHLLQTWGSSTNGGVPFYIMDNEHSIWHSTHQDVHPVGATMQEIWTKMLATAGMVKSNDPNAMVAGPEEWGWNGYFYSGYDQQWSGQHGDYNPAHYPDRGTNGGSDYMPWLLNQFHQHDLNSGRRLLDYFTLHCYPQEGNVGTSAYDTSTALLRNQTTRVFWDPNYVDPSWINSVIMLIPRMKSWVATYYPGTKIGVTEYNWGGEGNINGATAQADILGIFGREGLDLATRWTAVSTNDPVHKAMKMYRNYDGNQSTFGDVSVSASGPNPDNVSTFAALRSSDGALTLMVINKQLTAGAIVSVSLANFQPLGTGQVWQLTSANTITRLADISFSGSSFTATVPVQSITLFVLPPVVLAGPASNPNPPDRALGVATNTSLSWVAGPNISAHRVFFGVDPLEVTYATTETPDYKGTFTTPTWTPDPLAPSARFYWRVDELAGTNVIAGPVWTFGTALDPKAALPVTAGVATSPKGCLITFPTQLGQTYRVDATDSLNPPAWQPLALGIPGSGFPYSLNDPSLTTQPHRFYRALLLPP